MLTNGDQSSSTTIAIMMPCFNDWMSLKTLLSNIDTAVRGNGYQIHILIVDDASSVSLTNQFDGLHLCHVQHVQVLNLRRNLGHQRAIAIGLAYIAANLACRAVVVMDADGEDTPEDLMRLIQEYGRVGPDTVIFAQRSRRSESFAFRVGYILYKSLYRCLTGQRMRMGNFSLVPVLALQRVVGVSEIWNHYAAGLMRARIPYVEVRTVRGKRIDGQSTMNLLKLVIHGLSAIAVHSDIVGVRLLFLSGIFAFLVIGALIAVICIRFTTNLAIPGWASSVVGLLCVILAQLFLISIFFIFIILSSRNADGFLPCRDYKDYMFGVTDVKIEGTPDQAVVWDMSQTYSST